MFYKMSGQGFKLHLDRRKDRGCLAIEDFTVSWEGRNHLKKFHEQEHVCLKLRRDQLAKQGRWYEESTKLEVDEEMTMG